MRDEKVREPQLQRAYIVPSAVTAAPGEAEALSLLAEVLGGGAASRFYDKLVRGDGAATYAGANYRANGLDSSRFVIYGLPKPGVELSALEARMDSVIDDLLQNGISEEELARAKRSAIAQAIYSLDNQAALANIVGQALCSRSEPRHGAELARPRAGGDRRRGSGGRAKVPSAGGIRHRLPGAVGRAEKLMRAYLAFSSILVGAFMTIAITTPPARAATIQEVTSASRHQGLAGGGLHGPDRRDEHRLPRRCGPGPGRQGRTRQPHVRPSRRGRRRSRFARFPGEARGSERRDVLRRRVRCLLRQPAHAFHQRRRGFRALPPRGDGAALRRRAGRAHTRPDRR